MQLSVTMHMAQKYAVSQNNPKDVFTFLYKNFGCSRKVYNLCVDSLYRQLEAAGYQCGDDIPDPVFPKVSVLKKEYHYLKEVDSQGLANSVMDFLAAWKRFRKQPSHKAYTKRALRRDGSGTEPLSFRGLKGIPKFHAKAMGYCSYRTACQYPSGKNSLKRPTVRLTGDTLYIPKLKSGVKLVLHHSLPEDAHIENVTLSMEMDGSVHASICYSYTLLVDMGLQEAAMDETLPEGTTFLGLDYSQQDFYVDNEGRKANYPKYYRKSEERLSLLQRRLSHKEKDSRNYRKLLKQIRKLHTKIKNQRKDFLQKESTRLVEAYDVIVVEDLDLRGMGGALSLGKNLHDNGFGLFRNMLAYKLRRKGSCLVKVDRWFPSSKTCSCCGHVLESLELSDRTYVCPACGNTMDRDVNAAVNICEEGKRIFTDYLKKILQEEQEAADKAKRKGRQKAA